MTISINDPSVEAVIRERLQSGTFLDAEDVVRRALAHEAAEEHRESVRPECAAMTIDELFAPLRGLDIEIPRNPAIGRSAAL